MLRVWLPVALVVAVANASAAQPLQLFAASGKYGFKDEQGGVRIDARYDGASNFAEGLAAVGRVAGEAVAAEGRFGPQCFVETLRWGYIDPLGGEVIRALFEEARPFSNGRAAVRFDSKWGFIDSAGGWVVRPSFSEVGNFHDGLAWVRTVERGPVGYLDTSGRMVIAPRWNRGGGTPPDFKDGVVALRDEGIDVLLDRGGTVLARARGGLEPLGERVVAFREAAGGPVGVMTFDGRVVSAPQYDSVSPFSEARAMVTRNGRYGFIDRAGNEIIPLSFESAAHFREGFAAVTTGGRSGFVDTRGRLVIPSRFTRVEAFSNGVASACIEAGAIVPNRGRGGRGRGRGAQREVRCGLIDRTGRFMVSPRFSRIGSFERLWADATDAVFDQTVLVNRAGQIVDRGTRRDRPRREPYGQCNIPRPMPAPPPPDYRIDFALDSVPAGAAVFLVPIWDWESAGNGAQLLGDPVALEAYRVVQGLTPLPQLRLKAQAYMAVFDLGGDRRIARLDVTPTGPRIYQQGF